MSKSAILLMDNENRFNTFAKDLGMSVQNPQMCMYQKPTKLYSFQTFGLYTKNNKLSDFIKTKDGIIILVDHSKVTSNTIQRIDEIVKECPDIPILIVVDKEESYSRFSDNLRGSWDRDTILKQMEERNKKMEEANKLSNKLEMAFSRFTNVDHRKFFFVNSAGSYEPKEWFNTIIQKPRQIKTPQLTSINISSSELANRFEEGNLPLSIWDHYGRLRIVHYSIMKYGFKNTIDQNGWLCKNWREYKTSIGHGKLWHYTLTRFWMNVLYNLQKKYNYKSFNELYNNHPNIQKGGLFKEYYSNDVLFTDYARNNWVKPNLK